MIKVFVLKSGMFRKFFFVFSFSVFLTLSYTAFSQDDQEVARQLLEVADDIFENTLAYIQTRDAYVQVLEYDPENLRANYMAGFLYLTTVNKEKSVPYLVKAYSIDPDYSFDLLYLIGQAYQYKLDFNNAIRNYTLYLDKLRKNPGYKGAGYRSAESVNRRIRECENGIELVAAPLNYNITNIGPAVNSEWPDYGPSVSRGEDLIIFTSRRTEENTNENVFEDNFPYEDIFIASKKDEKWEKAKNIGNVINTPYFESVLTLSKDGRELYLYLDENNGDIYISNLRNDGSWSGPVPLQGAINTYSKETSVSISPDGNVIFFASDRPGSVGGLDIYYSTRDRRGLWTQVKNLGPVINTSYNEDFPFIDYDGKTLFFSSQGHKGMGGYDIFKSVYDSASAEWSSPVNIGYPINTPDDDISFISAENGMRGYFSSVREDGYGYQDIYMFTIPQEIRRDDVPDTEPEPRVALVPVKIIVYVKDESGNLLDADVQLRNNGDKFLYPVTFVNKGVYEAKVLVTEEKSFNISAEKNGYMFINQRINVPVAGTYETTRQVTLVMRKLSNGRKMVLRNIYFDFDKAELKPESLVEINKLYQMLADNARLIAEIAGHTDNVGSVRYNDRLSYLRAKAVVDILIKKGINPIRIKPVGYGETRPLASNDDEKEGRELNRRVEFRVLRYIY